MERLDKFLVLKGFVETRSKAQQLIESGAVLVDEKAQTKLSFKVDENNIIKIKENDVLKYVSRGGLKLEKAFEEFQISPINKVVLDIGSSTGGFTDCAIKYGAKKVVAVDVGTCVMVESLRKNPQVELHENLNIKDAANSLIQCAEMIVCDVSFISLKHIVEKVANSGFVGDMICLIKPQFECGISYAKKYNGVIKSKTVHKNVIKTVVENFNKCGFYLQHLTVSPIKGGNGNVEYVSHFSNTIKQNAEINTDKIVEI